MTTVTSDEGSVLVLGIGNVLLTDEGVGVEVAQRLADSTDAPLPPQATVVDGGTLGLDLLPLLDNVSALLVIDALDVGAAPGSVRVLRDAQLVASLSGSISVHELGVADLLAVARLRGGLPARTSLVGIQPASLEVGIGLSEPVAAAVPEAVRLARLEVSDMVGG